MANNWWEDFIEKRQDVMLGKPVFKGTRITVELVLNELGMGLATNELLQNYPTLTLDHLKAALAFAASSKS